jgi:hypothetical protein
MDSNTMQLVVVTPDHLLSSEVEMESTSKRGWRNRGGKSHGRHRVQDENARLKRELEHAQRLNETLSANLSAQIQETSEANARFAQLVQRLEDVENRLNAAESANEANANVVDFVFQPRPVDDPTDQATMPVPQAYLLNDDGEEPEVDPATALLDRVVPKTVEHVESQLVPAFAPPLVVVDYEELEEKEQLHDETQAAWNARPQTRPLVSWGGTGPTGRTLKTDQSSTGTYSVVPLSQRGTGPSALPGLAG